MQQHDDYIVQEHEQRTREQTERFKREAKARPLTRSGRYVLGRVMALVMLVVGLLVGRAWVRSITNSPEYTAAKQEGHDAALRSH